MTLKRGLDERRHFADRIHRLSSTPRSHFPQAIESLFEEASTPKCDRLEVDLERVGNVLVPMPSGGFQQDAAPLGHLLRSSMGINPPFEFEMVLGIQLNGPGNAGHTRILESKFDNSSHL